MRAVKAHMNKAADKIEAVADKASDLELKSAIKTFAGQYRDMGGDDISKMADAGVRFQKACAK